jgi:hypothetical protein
MEAANLIIDIGVFQKVIVSIQLLWVATLKYSCLRVTSSRPLNTSALDVIDEFEGGFGEVGSLGGHSHAVPSAVLDDDDGQSSDIFTPPTAIPNPTEFVPDDNVSRSRRSSSTDSNDNDAGTVRNVNILGVHGGAGPDTTSALVHPSPVTGSIKNKLRKKVRKEAAN